MCLKVAFCDGGPLVYLKLDFLFNLLGIVADDGDVDCIFPAFSGNLEYGSAWC